MKRRVTFYTTVNGKCPTRDFLDSLPGKAAQKVAWVLNLLEDLEVVPSTYFKKLSGTKEIENAGFNLVLMRTGYFVSSPMTM